ncbi:MAG: glycerophosphodiester phosphodiesterase family protein [Rhodothermia bacterium]|nr:MAG: glycerophosphodiester phosphodiesterase family protein [Rhodothermia bacterium]
MRKVIFGVPNNLYNSVSGNGSEITGVDRLRISITLCAVFISILSGCVQPADSWSPTPFDLQGHRGARGLAPENTIPAFVLALDLGVSTLELDVVLTADGDVVVSHDPWFSSRICSHPDGRPVSEDEERDLKIFEMRYEDIAGFDCGSRGNPDFLEQRAIATAKPLLKDVIQTSEAHTDSTDRASVFYNIEIKSAPDRDGVYYSSVAEYAQLLYDVLADQDVLSRATIQSFDPRALEAVKKIDPAVPLGFLVDNDISFSDNLDRLSFTPETYSPHHRLVDTSLVEEAHRLDIKVIPWTVNDEERMKELIAAGVDGFITDYPNRGVALLTTRSE